MFTSSTKSDYYKNHEGAKMKANLLPVEFEVKGDSLNLAEVIINVMEALELKGFKVTFDGSADLAKITIETPTPKIDDPQPKLTSHVDNAGNYVFDQESVNSLKDWSSRKHQQK